MSELGEISDEVRSVLDRLDRALRKFSGLDQGRLASIESQLHRSPQGRKAAALVAQARAQVRQAANGGTAARRAGAEWLASHGSSQGGGAVPGGETVVVASRVPGGDGAQFSSATVSDAWALGLQTPGGRAYFAASETNLRKLATSLPEFSGEYTLDAHGTDSHVIVAGESLSAAQVAELIRADPTWQNRPVRLFSCHTGSGESPIAAQLASELRVKVTAPDGFAWSDFDGNEGVAASLIKIELQGEVVEILDLHDEGSWHEFDPD